AAVSVSRAERAIPGTANGCELHVLRLLGGRDCDSTALMILVVEPQLQLFGPGEGRSEERSLAVRLRTRSVQSFPVCAESEKIELFKAHPQGGDGYLKPLCESVEVRPFRPVDLERLPADQVAWHR